MTKKRLSVILLSLGFILSLNHMSRAEILFPQKTMRVRTPIFPIIIMADSVSTTFPSVLKNRDNEGIIHLIIRLSFGKNTIPLILVEDGKVRKQSITVYYFPSLFYQENITTPSFHEMPFPDDCADCHTEDDNMRQCQTCHKDKNGEVKNPHEGFDPEDCSGCHNEETAKIETDCFDCHDPIKSKQHAPYATHDCVICHDPHGSNEKKLLRLPVRSLCALCHTGSYEEGTHPVSPHPIESKGLTCASCHNPHGSPFEFHLIQPLETVCNACHEK